MTAELAFLDLLEPGFRPDGPQVRAARAAHWYARTPMGLAVLRHQQLSVLLRDRRLAQGSHLLLTTQGITEGPLVDWMNSIILSIDGADHTRLRRLVSRAFTPHAVAALRPVMRQVTGQLIDLFAADGSVEFMTAFADPYPARIICELLGVPAALHDTVRGWANDLGLAFSYTAAANLTRIQAALAGLDAATDELIAARRDHPGPDLVSALLAAEADGDRLSTAELRTMVTGLIFAGQDTTRCQLGRILELFLHHPGQWALLSHRPELADRAVAEGLRLAPATTITGRVAITDLDVDGLRIPAGTVVSMLLAAGNTDPAAFGPDADRFDITASRPAAALTFGADLHYCLGAVLARAEMAEALPILARRLGPIHADGDAAQRPAMGITGPLTLPIRFSSPPRTTPPGTGCAMTYAGPVPAPGANLTGLALNGGRAAMAAPVPIRAPGGPGYAAVMGRTSQEYQRLVRQAQVWEPVTARVLTQTGIGPGMRCLDVGCGPGEVMRLLAGQVGSGGRVTGVDSDGQLGREGLGVLRATLPTPERLAFVEADVQATSADQARAFPGYPFDLVYARLLLHHLPDPVAVLRKLAAWARPGGLVIVQDYDLPVIGIWPPPAAWGEFERVIFGVYQRTGRDLEFGRKLPLHFAAAGLGEPDGTDVAGALGITAELSWFYESVYRSVLPAALRLGLTTAADSQAFLTEIATVASDRSRVCLCPLLISAWKHLPGPQAE